MKLRGLFTDHPASVDETYLEHAAVAGHFAKELAIASMAAVVHAIVPGLCCTSASSRIKQLHAEMESAHRGAFEAGDCHDAAQDTPVVATAGGISADGITAAAR